MTTEPLEQAHAAARRVLADVQPSQLGQSTPCASWKVSDLISYLDCGQFFFASMVEGEPDLAPQLAAGLLEGVRDSSSNSFRGSDPDGPFGPEQTAGANATAADRLAAFLGRCP